AAAGPRAAQRARVAAQAAPAAKAARDAKDVKDAKEAKRAARPPLVRDGFTMPEADFALIAQLKLRALEARRAAKKSELLRAGLHALAALDARTLALALDRLDPVRIGRPKKGR
ncbi:MAG: hypothetical protein KGO01_20255, partial [Burkholderiales bacterium]|nr:hypothetical protein [Burkholderiales bacterium]